MTHSREPSASARATTPVLALPACWAGHAGRLEAFVLRQHARRAKHNDVDRGRTGAENDGHSLFEQ